MFFRCQIRSTRKTRKIQKDDKKPTAEKPATITHQNKKIPTQIKKRKTAKRECL
jgi:hypothetical protein